MANITTTGTTGYPGALDTRTALTDGSSGDIVVAAHPNGLGAAVIAVETALGTNPQGSATDVKTRLATAHNSDGAVVLDGTAATVRALPKAGGGLGFTVASATFTDGFIPVAGNGVWQLVGLTGGTGITITPASGSITVSNSGSTAKISGDWVQMRRVSVSGATTTNGTIAVSNNPPTSGQGSGFGLSVDMLPTSTLNTVYLQASIIGCNDTSIYSPVAVFLAGSTSAVTSSVLNSGAAANVGSMSFLWKATTISTATTTYALRIGGSAGIFTLNGQAAGGLWSNSATSELMVWEVQN